MNTLMEQMKAQSTKLTDKTPTPNPGPESLLRIQKLQSDKAYQAARLSTKWQDEAESDYRIVEI